MNRNMCENPYDVKDRVDGVYLIGPGLPFDGVLVRREDAEQFAILFARAFRAGQRERSKEIRQLLGMVQR